MAVLRERLDTVFKEMNMVKLLITIGFTSAFLLGCSSNNAPLGSTVANLIHAQTYNPEAAQENLAIIPPGNGERLENVYQTYTGAKEVTLKGTSSQVVEGASAD